MMKHGPPPCHPAVMTRHDKTKASSHKASTVAIHFVRSIFNALMTMFSVAKDSEATMGPQGLSEARILTADLLFLMVATFRAIITLNSNSLKQPSKDSFLMGVSNSRSPAAEKTQIRPLGTIRIVSNQTLRIAIPFSHTITISKVNVVLSPELISMLRKTKKISTRMSKPSMRHMRMPTIRMPTGQNPRMSETRNQKIPTPSMIKILVTLLRVTSLRLLLCCTQKFKCRQRHKTFKSNNSLHRHIRAGLHLKESGLNETAVPSMVVDPAAATSEATTSQVICSTSTDTPVEGYAFRGFHYVTAMVQLFFLGLLFDLCFDTDCTMSLIDIKFLLINHPDAEIKKISTPMTVKRIGSKRHEASEYVRIKMYLPGKKGAVALIERELHVVDNLTAKALIGIDIMKPEGIVLDLQNDVMRVGACQDLEIPIVVTARGFCINVTIYSSKRMRIPPHSKVAVPVTGPRIKQLDLHQVRDFIFEPQTLDSLSAYAHVVDHTISKRYSYAITRIASSLYQGNKSLI